MKRLENGKVHLGHKKLNHDDFKRILAKLGADKTIIRTSRPRKCRKLDGANAILAMLPPPVPVHYFNVVGNRGIGNAGMAHLHLLPDTVVDFDVADCGLDAEGIKVLCEYLKTNTSITRMVMWGNNIGDEGAKHIADMLKVNTTIEELCVMGSRIGPQGFLYLSDGLAVNKTLRWLSCGNDQDITDIHVACLYRGLKLNRGLETLELGQTSITRRGVHYIEKSTRDNLSLRNVRISQFLFMDEETYIPTGRESAWYRLCYTLTLNKMNRKIVEDEQATLTDWLDSVIMGSQCSMPHFSYFFLRNKPELCMYSHR